MKFKKGDRVKVKSWRTMAEDSRVHIDSTGAICELMAPYSFSRIMGQKYCKCTATVLEVSKETENLYLMFDGEENPEPYSFREWMLEEAADGEFNRMSDRLL